MDTTLSSVQFTSKYHWFDRFLAVLCIFFGLFMIAGLGTSASVITRNVDASLGLLKREVPYYFKNIDKINFLTKGVDVSAITVIIGKNPDLDLKEILILAFKFVLKKVVAFLLNSLRGVLNNLLSSIRTWINTLSGLLDSVKSFLSALAMKVFALQECLVRKSEDVASAIFGFSFSKIGSILSSACGSSSGSSSAAASTALSRIGKLFSNGTTGSDMQTFINGLSNFRLSSLLYHANSEVVPSSQPGEAPKESGTNTLSANFVVGSADLAIKQSELANTAGILGCDKSNNSTTSSIFNFESWSAYNPSCVQFTVNANEEISKTVAIDKDAYDKGKKNTVDAAPADCKFTGYLTDTPQSSVQSGSVPTSNVASGSPFSNFASGISNLFNFKGNSVQVRAQDASTSLNFSGLTTNFAETEDFAANTVSFTKDFDTKILTGEQCKAADSLPATLNNQQTQTQASNKSQPVDSSLDGALGAALNDAINDLIKGITEILNDFVKQVFQLVIQLVNKFTASLPGGEFLSQSLTSSITSAETNITNSITRGLNRLKNPIR